MGRLRVCPDDLYFEGAIPDCARWGFRTTVSIAKHDGRQHVPDRSDSCFHFLRSYSTLGLTESTRCALRSYPRNRSPLLFAVAEIFQLSVYVLRTRHATTPCIAFCYALHPINNPALPRPIIDKSTQVHVRRGGGNEALVELFPASPARAQSICLLPFWASAMGSECQTVNSSFHLAKQAHGLLLMRFQS